MVGMFKQNPQQIINSLMMNNPNMQEVSNLIQKCGSPEEAFRQKAQEMGIDPDEFISLMK